MKAHDQASRQVSDAEPILDNLIQFKVLDSTSAPSMWRTFQKRRNFPRRMHVESKKAALDEATVMTLRRREAEHSAKAEIYFKLECWNSKASISRLIKILDARTEST